MGELKQVRLSGFGGQGVVLAGTILGFAAIKDGKWVAGSSSYGAQARGGAARSDVVVSDSPIVYPHVIRADILVAMAQTAYDKYTEELSPDPIVIYDEGLVTRRQLGSARQLGVPATSSSIERLRQQQSANIVMLGAAAAITGVASMGSLRAAIVENTAERFHGANLEALELGYQLGQESRHGC